MSSLKHSEWTLTQTHMAAAKQNGNRSSAMHSNFYEDGGVGGYIRQK